MRITATCLVAGLAALAACSKAPSPGASASATAAAPAQAAASSPGPSIFAPPHPKPGLWEMAMTNDAGPGMSFTGEVCIDANTERSAFEGGSRGRPKDCGEAKMGPGPNGGVAIDSTCTAGGRKMTTHVVASGDFNSAYTMDMTTHMDPPLPGMANGIHTQMQAHWLGPCQPGQTPGHMTMKMGGLGRG